MVLRCSTALLILAAFALPVAAEEYGDVTGVFLFDGPVPQLPPVGIPAGIGCGRVEIPDDSLLVDPATKGLANVYIWVKKIAPEAIHPDLRKPAQNEVLLDCQGCSFVPHAMVARAGQKLRVRNADAISHSPRANPVRHNRFDLVLAPNDRVGQTVDLTKPEPVPTPIQCPSHLWMKTWLLVIDHPYAALSNGQGKFTIRNLPAGKHAIRIWHERFGFLEDDVDILEIDVEAGKTIHLSNIAVKE